MFFSAAGEKFCACGALKSSLSEKRSEIYRFLGWVPPLDIFHQKRGPSPRYLFRRVSYSYYSFPEHPERSIICHAIVYFEAALLETPPRLPDATHYPNFVIENCGISKNAFSWSWYFLEIWHPKYVRRNRHQLSWRYHRLSNRIDVGIFCRSSCFVAALTRHRIWMVCNWFYWTWKLKISVL